jgi:argininosuccinate lyase
MAFAIAILMNHLSSMAQTLILFSTGEFGILRLDDAHTTGSSMMPQKRNPDPLEVIKAKAGLAQGILMGLLSTGESLFLGYNRDTQWTKYSIMDLVDECAPAPKVIEEIISSLQADKEKMTSLCQRGFIAAPDLLERIVHEGKISFRQGKGAVENAVKYSEAKGLEHISSPALHRALKEEGLKLKFEEKFVNLAQDPTEIISRRDATGGTSPEALTKNILSLNQSLKISRKWLSDKRKQHATAQTRLAVMEGKL